MTSTTSQPEIGTEDESLWWHLLVSPTKMFHDLPETVAIVLYCCVIVGVVLLTLILMWLCSSCLAKRGKKNPTKNRGTSDSRKNNSVWSTSGSGKINGHDNNAFEMQERNIKQQNFDTFKHVESMPWWDYVSNNPSVNWYEYYQKSGGRNRSKTCERKGYPWRSAGDANRGHKRKRSSKSPKEKYAQINDIDSCWENVRPQNVDASQYWQRQRALDTRYFPRFRMIPRASWSNERLLGCFGPNCYGDNYGNHSMASLTSTDMQIMQMIARRRDGFVRPTRGDVFYGNCLALEPSKGNCQQNYTKNSTSQTSSYDDHNLEVARRHTFRTFSANNDASTHPTTSTPLPKPPESPPSSESYMLDMPPPPPSPPAYPPPPTPLRSQSHRNDIELRL